MTAVVRGGAPTTDQAGDAQTVLLPPIVDLTTVLPEVTDSETRATGRPADRRTRRRILTDVTLALGLTALVMTVQAWNVMGFPSASDDEGTYLAQAWAVQHGLGLAHYTYWYDHPPLAWIQLAGLSWLPAALLPKAFAVGAGRLAMLPVAATSLLLVYLIARRLGFARWAAALALVSYGMSPISVTMMRQIYLDSFAVVWMLAAFALALSPRKHLWHHVASGVAVALAVLSKETMLVVAPAVVVALWQSTSGTTIRAWAFGGFLCGVVLPGAFYPLYAILKGELLPGPDHVSLIGAWQFQLQHRQGSGSVFTAGSNSNMLLNSWLYYDRVLLLGGVAATVVALVVSRLRAPALAAGLLVLVALRPDGYLPAMYVVQALPFLAIGLAGIIEVLLTWMLSGELRTEIGQTPRRAARPGVRLRWLRASAVGVVAIAALWYVVPRWYVGDQRAVRSDDNAGYMAAADWLRGDQFGGGGDRASTSITTATIVVDDVLWLDLVRSGYQRDRVIWFYKLDLDSAVAARLPHGWRDVDYIVSSPAVRQDPQSLPSVEALLTHSTVVKTFGSGDGRIEVRQITKEQS